MDAAESNHGVNSNFITEIIDQDLKTDRCGGHVVTRFPPEPNGYLHIGHAKSICLNFGTAKQYGGICHMRLDDTNPTKEDTEYVDSILNDVRWLGGDWGDQLFYASDYFEKLYGYAVELIKRGKAYVCNLTEEEFNEYKGTLTVPGRPSPCRDRSIEENLDLFERMRKGEFPDGAYVLRAKIDMASPNMHMRDPAIYRIRHASHHRTGDKWCIYPLYDFAHCLSDSIEGITHSICTLEFEIHRPLYDWILDALETPCHPRQIEFARLNLTYTVMSKRKLLELVKEGRVSGWDDPRMPTICAYRRRGVPAVAIRNFCEKVGVTKFNSLTDIALLDYCIREELNKTANRYMVVMNPVKLVIDNYPDGLVEEMDAVNNPEDPSAGTRKVPFSKEVYIEETDFMEVPVKQFHRLSPGAEVRLRYAYLVTCTSVVKDENGKITEIHCTYDPASKGGNAPGGLTSITIPFVGEKADGSGSTSFDYIFGGAAPDSLKEVSCFIEPALKSVEPGAGVQFERTGYFCLDKLDSKDGALVFNRTVALKDSWQKKIAQKN